MSWNQAVRSRRLDPLGLADTFVYGYEPTPGFVRGYTSQSTGWIDESNYLHPTNAYAAGCMVSNARDLVRWSQALHGAGVLSAASLQAMMHDHRVPREYAGYFMGLGIFIEGDATYGELYGHTGGLSGYSTSMELLEQRGITPSVICNCTEDPTKRLKEVRGRLWMVLLGL